jgi:hypothetical protein
MLGLNSASVPNLGRVGLFFGVIYSKIPVLLTYCFLPAVFRMVIVPVVSGPFFKVYSYHFSGTFVFV